NEKTLSNNDNFKSFNDNLSSSSNIFIYNNVARSINLYKQYAIEDHLPIFDEKIEVFRKFEALAFQVSSEKNGLFYNNIQLKYNPIYKQETASLWELALDSTISSAPKIVLNHKTKAKEIFVQDDANKIYLISNIGKVIWTKQLQEPIMGEVQQIDVYKNNKLQLLFNTKSKIYLIDRNGNNVEKYPVSLPSNATNEVTALDYVHNRNYRVIIGCDDNMVYNYDITGSKTKGWEYKSENSPAKGKVWHFIIANKDYIVVPLKNGKIKVIQRNGKDRLNLENKLAVSDNAIYLKNASSLEKTVLTTIDSLGNVSQLFLNGKTALILNEDAKAATKFNYFDFDNNKQNDFVFTNNNSIKILDAEKKVLYENEFETAIKRTPQIFKLADKTTKIGVVTEKKIYLINTNGAIEDGFPLVGSTPFSIDDINNDNTNNLVVAHGKMIYTYNLK
ncbi:MAG: PQQ-binding-like beta-propeller repeat protein, partial [Vicingaceae bacterium]|nr:PQQ-binding-like beta-propeller repeat protein [Vicingaceae bacterium]